jgi:uncharacterized membrane protein
MFSILLFLHVVAGMTSLIVGLYVMVVRKGDKRHKRVGQLFFYAMLTSASISLPMAIVHPNPFLFVVGLFTIYLLLSGKMYLSIQKLEDITIKNWILTAIMTLFGVGFIIMAIWMFLHGNSFGYVMITFGSMSILLCFIDYRNYLGRSLYSNFGLVTHIQRMVGAYIASVTAFTVVNNTYLPNIIAWLAPGAILTPLIIVWIRKWGKK